MFLVLKKTGVVRTKHGRAVETEVLSIISICRDQYESLSDDDLALGNAEILSSRTSHCSRSLTGNMALSPQQCPMTMDTIPRQPRSTSRRKLKMRQAMMSKKHQHPVKERRQLRNVLWVQYSYSAVPMVISTNDYPSISEVLEEHEGVECMKSIPAVFFAYLQEMQTSWVEMPPTGTKLLRSGTVLKLKRNADCHPKRFRWCVIARGSGQVDGFDYEELYAPVSCIEIVRTLLSVAAAKSWDVEHLDIKSAFLYARFNKGTPEGYILLSNIPFIPYASCQIVRLLKALHGSFQAPKL